MINVSLRFLTHQRQCGLSLYKVNQYNLALKYSVNKLVNTTLGIFNSHLYIMFIK